jgi:type IV pilus assembly protein PilF
MRISLRCIRSPLIFILFATILSGCAQDKALIKKQAQAKQDLGKSLLADGNYAASLSELMEAVRLDPENPEIHNALALTYREMKMYTQAISHFDQAIELRPDYSEACNNLGTVYLILADWDRAIGCFKKALTNSLYATPHFAYNNLGRAYHEKGQFKLAVEAYLKAVQTNQAFSRAHHNLGITYEALGEWDKALEAYTESIRYAPDDPRSYLRLGKLYLRLNKLPLAIQNLEETIRLDKRGIIAPEAKRLLERIQ